MLEEGFSPFRTDQLGWDSDRLLTRLITAVQAETKYPQLDVRGLLTLLVDSAADVESMAELRALNFEKFLVNLRRLAADGWVSLDETNPHVAVAPKGLMLCGALRIPERVKAAVRPRIDAVALD